MREMEIEQLRRSLAGRREIKFAILYGSATDSDDYNDLDVALFVDPEQVSDADALFYGFGIENELRKVVAHPVDVRVINHAPPAFRFNVIKGIPLVVNDEDAYYRFRESSWAEYLDLEPLYHGYFREVIYEER